MRNYAFYTVLCLAVFTIGKVQAQCTVEITPATATIQCGESVNLSAVGLSSTPALQTNFNGNQIGAGWTTTAAMLFTNPCGPSLDGTPSAWFGNVSLPRTLISNGFDLSCGGQVCFDLDFAGDDNTSGNCEDPDLVSEGVYFSYSVNGGITWIDIFYFQPTSNISGPYYSWATYCFTLPPGAWSTNTMFRWDQPNISSSVNDHWGLDNITITPTNCGYWYDWDNLAPSNDPAQQTVSPLATTNYVVSYTDGVNSCMDTIQVIVEPLIANATAQDTALTCLQCTDLNSVITNSNAGSIVDDFDPNLNSLMWDDIQGGGVGIGCGGNPGNALYFNGTGPNRFAITNAVDATTCGMINFSLRMGSASSGASCGNPGTGENVVLEYSTNNGISWNIILTYNQANWDTNPAWQSFTVPIPPPAQTTNTMFRWRQVLFTSCATCDNWSLDNVNIPCAPPAYIYAWSPATGLDDPNVQDPQACPVVPTTYTATITDPTTGCFASDAVTINVTCTCTIFGTTAVVSQCENGNQFTVSGEFNYIENPGTGNFIVEVTNASGSYTQVFPAPFMDTTLQTYSISGIIADGSPITVDFYFTDDLNCTDQLNEVSPVLPTLTTISGGGVYCPGNAINDIVVEVTGNAPWTIDYLLDGVPASASGNSSTISLGNAEGIYELVTVNDAGCTNTATGNDSIIINDLPLIIDLFGGDDYCAGDPITPIEIELSGTAPWTVQYTVGGVPQTLTGNAVPLQLGTNPGIYVVTSISDANCSSVTNDSETIVINPAPNVQAGNDFISCENESVVLSGSGAQSYVWDNGVTNGSSFVPTTTLTYTVVGTSANGCTGTDQITVTVEPLPVVLFVADSTQGCEPFMVNFVNLTSGNLVNCVWNFGDGSAETSCDSIQHVYQYGGTFDVTLSTTTVNGCFNTITYTDYIYVEDNPLASFLPSTQQVMSLDPEVYFDNNSMGAVNYIWNFGDGSPFSEEVNPVHSFPGDETTGYPVTLYAYSPIGCVDSARMVIQVNQEMIYYVPNTFTPDDDEYNQSFVPVFTDGYDPYDFNMKIYNRWGELIFETNNDKIGWDGTYGGQLVPDGTYTWKIEFKTIASDERVMITGHLNLIR